MSQHEFSQPHPADFFGPDLAQNYDQQFSRLAPLRDALQLTVRCAFRTAPSNARALIVGAGTGAEVMSLADAYPGWSFTIVEPAPAMLAICKDKVIAAGLSGRCEFHEGFVEDLPDLPRHHIATAVLVSQFILDRSARVAFFRAIADRLTESGVIVSADLATDGGQDDPVMAFWGEIMRVNGMSDEDWKAYQETVARAVAIAAPAEVEAIMVEGGFAPPVQVFQAALIHGWVSRPTANRAAA